ncbi:MAG: S-methyl-5-thioribose-1-phosphate isomerase [SAR202 cluster bacterium]|nr:S-methyl-5-thioribose-1-phosphate isomerase [SAR202 cluster bacterium]
MLLDQTHLPSSEVWLELADYRAVVEAIKHMRVRGAPAIGIAGAYAVVLAAGELTDYTPDEFQVRLKAAADVIANARPTGANLAWAVRRMMAHAHVVTSPSSAEKQLLAEALRIHEEDEKANRRMGKLGADLLPQGAGVLTHCNTGALATGGHGTALGVIRSAWEAGKLGHVYATETRPLLQGARLTAWELMHDHIPATLLPDSAAGQLMRQRKVQAVIVGADRIAANGDTANKIGTYSLAVLAKEHGIPLYVAAPFSTIDLTLSSGEGIVIEDRSAREVTHFGGYKSAPDGIAVMNPAFDVTPNDYIAAIITELGVARKPYTTGLANLKKAHTHG